MGGNPGDVSAAYLNRLLTAGQDVASVQQQLKRALAEGSFEPLLERINAVREDVPKLLIEPLITALLNLSDDLPEVQTQSMFSSGLERDLVRLIITLLRQLPDKEGRAAILQKAALASTAVTGPAMLASALEPEDGEQLTGDDLVVDLRSVKRLQQELLPRIWGAAGSGRVWDLRMSAFLVYRLRKWDTAKSADWIRRAVEQPQVALKFMMSMLGESQVSGGGGSRSVYRVMAAEMEKFVDLNLLIAAESVASEELEKAAVDGLKVALDRKSKGQPYAEIYAMSRGEDGRLFYDERDRRW